MSTLIRSPRLREGLGNFILVFLSVGIVILYSSYRRPLWIDELLHYAWGGFRNQVAVLPVIVETTVGINHGQTGLHMWINGLTLQATSSSSLLLRLPVIAAGVLLMISGAWLIRALGYSIIWQAVALLAIAGSSFLMYYQGESRPYFPLAAGVALSTTYLVARTVGYSRIALTALAWVVVVLGSLWHPYFPLYIVLLAIFAMALGWWLFSTSAFPVKRFWSIGLFVAVSVTVGLIAGLATWLSRSLYRNEEFDPFEFVRPNGGFVTVWVDTHFQFFPLPGVLAPFVLTGLVILLVFLVFVRFSRRRIWADLAESLVPPLALVLLSLGISGILSAISLYQNYWILNRQWMASLALVPIGTVWFLAALFTYLKPRVRWAAYALAIASFFVIGAMAAYRLYGQVGALQSYAATAAEYHEKYAGVTVADSQRLYDELGPVEAANVNIYLGGPVWPVFSCFYGCEDGYQDRIK